MIAASAVILRLALFPIYVISTKNNLKMAKIQPEMRDLQTKILMNRRKGTKEGNEAAEHYLRRITEVMKRENYSPYKSFLLVAQFPIFITFFITMRRMAANVESFQWGGILWFSDLTLADPTYVLPVLSAIFVLISIEVSDLTNFF